MGDLQANLDIVEYKKREVAALAAKDKEFSNEVRLKQMQQDIAGREAELAKRKVYKNAILDQRDDISRRRRMQKLAEDRDNLELKHEKEAENQQYFQERDMMNADKRQKYHRDLETQKRHKELKDQDESALNRDLDAKNRNYLIDDAWKQNHKARLAEHHKDGLINQMKDKEEDKNWEVQRKIADDEQYRDDLRRANDSDLRKRVELDKAKKGIFVNEIKNQEAEKQRQRELDHALSQADDDVVRQKLLGDHMKYLDAEKRKKDILQGHLKGLEQQKRELETKKKNDIIMAKKPHGTTLLTKGDNVKYFDFLDCMQMYPLKNLKRKKRAKKQ